MDIDTSQKEHEDDTTTARSATETFVLVHQVGITHQFIFSPEVDMSRNPTKIFFRSKGAGVSREMMNHAQAQILRLHLHLDDLKQWLDSNG